MFTTLTDTQSKYFINTEQLHLLYKDALIHSIDYRGGMSWKKINGVEYLYRRLDRKGNAKSLGKRSEKTEEIYSQFTQAKTKVQAQLFMLKNKLNEQARMNKALKIARCPQIVSNIVGALDNRGLMGSGIEIIGTNALYAYESMSGVQILQESLETTDIDLLLDSRAKISILAPETFSPDGIIGVLKDVDDSFRIVEKSNFRAVNNDGFLVDLIRQMPNPPWANARVNLGQNDMVATDIWNMKWMLSMPKVSQTVIAKNGMPFTMVVPDPRAFALFKFWLSESSERDPKKKGRDKAQSNIVRKLIEDYLPQFKFSSEQLKAFPSDVVARSKFCL